MNNPQPGRVFDTLVIDMSNVTHEEAAFLRGYLTDHQIKTVSATVIPCDWKENRKAQELRREGVRRIRADYTTWEARPNQFHDGHYCLDVKWQRYPATGSINTYFTADNLAEVVAGVLKGIQKHAERVDHAHGR